MKIVCAILILAASLAGFGQTEFSKQTVAPNPEFTLEITANLNKEHSNLWDFVNCTQTAVESGSTVVVAIRKTNISDHEILKTTHANEYYGYYFDVHDSNGDLVPLSHPGRVIYTGDGRGGYRVGTNDKVLQPGESIIKRDDVSDIWDISKPGVYTFQVSAHISNDPKSDVVKSNIITVTVLPSFRLTISEHSGLTAGQHILAVRVTNLSKEAIKESGCLPLPFREGVKLAVLYNGQPVEMDESLPSVKHLRAVKASHAPCSGSLFGQGAQPNMADRPEGAFETEVNLTEFFDMSKPGTYEVTVSKETFPRNQEKSTTVQSNTLTIIVPEPE